MIAQNESSLIDSTILLSERKDTGFIRELIRESKSIRLSYPSQGMQFAEKALKLSEEVNDAVGLIDANYELGAANYIMTNNEVAMMYTRKSVILAEKNNLAQKVGVGYILIGYIFDVQNQIDSSLYYTFKAVKVFENNNITRGLGHAYYGLGMKYYLRNDLSSAEKYYRLALSLAKVQMDSFLLSGVLSTLASLTDSMHYALSAIPISKKIGSFGNLVNCYNSLGDHNQIKNNIPEAIKYFNLSYKYATLYEDQILVIGALKSLAVCQMTLGLMDSAEIGFLKSFELAKEYELVDEQVYIADLLGGFYEKKGSSVDAANYYKIASILKDTIFNSSISENTTKYNALWESEKKEKQIAEQELEIARQSNARNRTLFGGIAALLLASSLFTWYYQRQKRKKQETELALKLEKSEADNLRHLDELKSNFFTNLSHELRTPLTLIMGPLENAKDKASEIVVKKEIDLAHKNASKLHGLVNEIMDLSKLEAGKLEMSNRQLPFIPLLRRIFFSFESLAAMRNIKLSFINNLNDSYLINTDLKRFEKVLNNLISNAIKFSNNNDSIQLNVDKNSENIFFQVVDTGKGIHPDDLPFVFDRFYQTSQSGHLDGGTGVGLAYANEIVKRFNGQLNVTSTLGKGSTFTCSLPLDNFNVVDSIEDDFIPEVNNPLTKINYVPITVDGHKPKILIVEDNSDMQDYLLQIMSPFYSCTVANDGLDALQKLKERNFDLITSDIMMPRMDGFEFKAAVNQKNSGNTTPFIMLTARSMEEDKLRGLRLGVDDYLTKPFSSDELLTRMNNLLINKQQRDEYLKTEDNFDPSSLNAEQTILKNAEDFIQQNMDSLDLSVPLLAKDLGYSQRQVTRVLKKLTGLTPVNFILEIRLQKARYLLESKSFLSVDEVRYEIGIESASYFSRKFKERFGKNPSGYL